MRISSALAACGLGALLVVTSCSAGGGSADSRTFNATGTWNGTYIALGDSHAFTAEVVQAGTSISGAIDIPLIDVTGASLTGEVNGDSIQFGDIERTISFSGKVQSDDTAEGTYTISYNGSSMAGSWTASCMRRLTLTATVTVTGSAEFGTGLTWDGSRLWVSASQVLQALSPDGSLLASYIYNGAMLPFHNFECLAFDGTSIWATEDNTGAGYDEGHLYAISPSDGAISADLPAPPDGSGSGITPAGLNVASDGNSLWCLRNPGGAAQTIYKINPSTGAVLGSIPAPLSTYGSYIMVGGFGAAAGDLWISDRVGYIYRVRASDGHMTGRFDFQASVGGTGPGPQGIAWDGSHLWVRESATLYCFVIPSGFVN